MIPPGCVPRNITATDTMGNACANNPSPITTNRINIDQDANNNPACEIVV